MAKGASIVVELSPGLQNLLRNGPAAFVQAAVIRAMDRENELTVGQAVAKRMSFSRHTPPTMEGLRVQSGRLRRSITRAPAQAEGARGVISAIGSNVRYFAPHEFGFDGTVSVKEHERKLPDRVLVPGAARTLTMQEAGRAGFLTKAGKLRKGTGERLEGRTITVRAHSAHRRIPARQMVSKTITERMPLYQLAMIEELQKAIA